MSRPTRRLRGALLRLAYSRPAAVLVGLLLVAPGVWLARSEYRWETWLTDGLGLVLAATGVAILLAGISGRRPDWID